MARKDARAAESPTPRERPVTYKGLGADVGKVEAIVEHPSNAAFLNVTVARVVTGGRTMRTTYEAVPRKSFVDEDGQPIEIGAELSEVPRHLARTYDMMPWSPFDEGETDEF